MSLTSSCPHGEVSSSKVVHLKLFSMAEHLAISVKVNSCLVKGTPGIFIKLFIATLLDLSIKKLSSDRFSSLLDT